MKRIIWAILAFIDDYLNHKFIENILDKFDSDWSYRIWEKTCYAYCSWLNDKVYGWAFPEPPQERE